MRLVEQKILGPTAFSGSLAEVLTLLAIGILVCAVLYTACSFYEGVLLRRKASWNYIRVNLQTRPPKV
jgi:hypothetical protein